MFKRLKDSHFSIPSPVRIGRRNPFLPIGFDPIINATSSFEDLLDSKNSENDASSFFDSSDGTLDINTSIDLNLVNSGGQ